MLINKQRPNFGEAGSRLKICSQGEYLKFVSYVKSKLYNIIRTQGGLLVFQSTSQWSTNCKSQILKIQIKYYLSQVITPDPT